MSIRVMLVLAEGEDLPAKAGGLVELGAEQVEAGETAEHGELLVHVGAALEQVQDTRERGLHLGREPLRRHERTGEGRPQGDLLAGPVGRRRDGLEDGEHVRCQVDRLEIPAVGIVEDQQRPCQLVELLEVAFRHPVRPTRAAGSRCPRPGRRARPRAAAGQIGEKAPRHRGEVGGMRPASAHAPVGTWASRSGELPDGLEHRHPRLAARRVDPAHEALLDEAGQPFQDVQLDAIDRPRSSATARSRRPRPPRTPPAARTGAARPASGARSSSPSSPAASAGAPAGHAGRCAGARGDHPADPGAPLGRTAAGAPQRARSRGAGRRADGRCRPRPRRCRRSARSRGGPRAPGR